jgi:hypothetical protein
MLSLEIAHCLSVILITSANNLKCSDVRPTIMFVCSENHLELGSAGMKKILETLIVAQLMEKFHEFYGTRRLSTVFTGTSQVRGPMELFVICRFPFGEGLLALR